MRIFPFHRRRAARAIESRALAELAPREDVVALALARCGACGVVVHLVDGVEFCGVLLCWACGRRAAEGTAAESEFERAAPRGSSDR